MTAASVREAAVVSTVTRGLTSTMSPPEMFSLAARLARRLLDARRATILLLDDNACLVPEISVAHDADEELFARFRDMTPISLTQTPGAWELLQAGEVVVVPRVAESPVVPEAWRDTFGLSSLAIAPLLLEGEPCGALVVEGDQLGASSSSTVRAMGTIAAMTALAVGGARRQRSDVTRLSELELVGQALRAMSVADDISDVAELGLDALIRLVSADAGCVLVITEDGRVDPLARRKPLEQQLNGDRIADWTGDDRATCRSVADLDGSHTVTVPVPLDDDRGGLCVLDVPASLCPPEDRLVLTHLLGQALGREVLRAARERDRRLLETCRRVLHRFASAGTSEPLDVLGTVAELARTLRWATGWEPSSVLVADGELATAVGAARVTGAMTAVFRSWSRDPEGARPVVVTDGTLMPLRAEDGALLGGLQLRLFDVSPMGHDRRVHVDEIVASLEATLTAARDRLAAAALCAQLSSLRDWRARVQGQATTASSSPASLAALMAVVGEDVDEQAAPVHRSFARTLGQHLPPHMQLKARVRGRSSPLPVSVEALLRRLLRELVVGMCERSRAQQLTAELRFDAASVTLQLRDDGLALAQRTGAATGLFHTLRTLAVRCDQLGGSLQVTNVDPVGIQAVAVLPLQQAPRKVIDHGGTRATGTPTPLHSQQEDHHE